MGESRQVRCLDCGHEWDCSAKYPQCSDPNGECGRSRNVEPIAEIGDSDSDTPGDSESRSVENQEMESGSESQDSDSGWSPIFESETTETEPIDSPSSGADNLLNSTDEDTGEDTDETESVSFAGGDAPALDGDDIRMFIKTPFDMAASSRGDHWELNDEELDQLSASYANVANKWGPQMMGEYGPEILAALTTMAVVGPRVAEDKKQADDEPESDVDDDSDVATERTDAEVESTESPAEQDRTGFAYSQV